jgi:hypothetical protein
MRRRVDLNLSSHLASLSVSVAGNLQPDHTLQWVEAQLPNFVALGALTRRRSLAVAEAFRASGEGGAGTRQRSCR